MSMSSKWLEEWHKRIFMPFFYNHQYLVTGYLAAFSNPHLMSYLVSTNHPELDWRILSSNIGLTIELVSNNPKLPWCWEHVSCNPGITMKDVINHPDYPWVWGDSALDHLALSSNPNLTINMINQYPDKAWNWNSISRNRSDLMDYSARL